MRNLEPGVSQSKRDAFEHACDIEPDRPVCFACKAPYAERDGEACFGCVADGIACACRRHYVAKNCGACIECLTERSREQRNDTLDVETRESIKQQVAGMFAARGACLHTRPVPMENRAGGSYCSTCGRVLS